MQFPASPMDLGTPSFGGFNMGQAGGEGDKRGSPGKRKHGGTAGAGTAPGAAPTGGAPSQPSAFAELDSNQQPFRTGFVPPKPQPLSRRTPGKRPPGGLRAAAASGSASAAASGSGNNAPAGGASASEAPTGFSSWSSFLSGMGNKDYSSPGVALGGRPAQGAAGGRHAPKAQWGGAATAAPAPPAPAAPPAASTSGAGGGGSFSFQSQQQQQQAGAPGFSFASQSAGPETPGFGPKTAAGGAGDSGPGTPAIGKPPVFNIGGGGSGAPASASKNRRTPRRGGATIASPLRFAVPAPAAPPKEDGPSFLFSSPQPQPRQQQQPQQQQQPEPPAPQPQPGTPMSGISSASGWVPPATAGSRLPTGFGAMPVDTPTTFAFMTVPSSGGSSGRRRASSGPPTGKRLFQTPSSAGTGATGTPASPAPSPAPFAGFSFPPSGGSGAAAAPSSAGGASDASTTGSVFGAPFAAASAAEAHKPAAAAAKQEQGPAAAANNAAGAAPSFTIGGGSQQTPQSARRGSRFRTGASGAHGLPPSPLPRFPGFGAAAADAPATPVFGRAPGAAAAAAGTGGRAPSLASAGAPTPGTGASGGAGSTAGFSPMAWSPVDAGASGDAGPRATPFAAFGNGGSSSSSQQQPQQQQQQQQKSAEDILSALLDGMGLGADRPAPAADKAAALADAAIVDLFGSLLHLKGESGAAGPAQSKGAAAAAEQPGAARDAGRRDQQTQERAVLLAARARLRQQLWVGEASSVAATEDEPLSALLEEVLQLQRHKAAADTAGAGSSSSNAAASAAAELADLFKSVALGAAGAGAGAAAAAGGAATAPVFTFSSPGSGSRGGAKARSQQAPPSARPGATAAAAAPSFVLGANASAAAAAPGSARKLRATRSASKPRAAAGVGAGAAASAAQRQQQQHQRPPPVAQPQAPPAPSEAQRHTEARARSAMWKERAHASYTSGEYARAEEEFTQAIDALVAVDPRDDGLPTLYSNRSGARLMLNRPHAALGDARRSTAASRRKFVRGHLREATCLTRLGRLPEALRVLDGLLDCLAPSNASYQDVVKRLRDGQELTRRMEALEKEVLGSGGSSSSASAAPSRASSRPGTAGSGSGANVAAGAADPAVALAPLPPGPEATRLRSEAEDLAREVTFCGRVQAVRAWLLLRGGHLDVLATGPITRAPDSPREAGEGEGEQADAGQTRSNERFDWEWWVLAQVHYHKGDLAAAAATLRRGADALRAAPQPAAAADGDVWGSGAAALAALLAPLMPAGPEQAVVLAEALESAVALKDAGNTALAKSDCDGAVAKYTEALQMGVPPGFAAVLYCNRGAAHQKVSRWTEALADCGRAAALNPGYAKAHSRAAAVMAAVRRPAVALTVLEALLAGVAPATGGAWTPSEGPGRPAKGAAPVVLDTTSRDACVALKNECQRVSKWTRTPDYFGLLGIEQAAGDDDVKKAFRKLALKLHPDKAMQHCRYTLRLGECGVAVIPGLPTSGDDDTAGSHHHRAASSGGGLGGAGGVDCAAAAALEARIKAEAGVLFNLINEASEELSDASKRRRVIQLLDAEKNDAKPKHTSPHARHYAGGYNPYGSYGYGSGYDTGGYGYGGYSSHGTSSGYGSRSGGGGARQNQQQRRPQAGGGGGSRGYSGYAGAGSGGARQQSGRNGGGGSGGARGPWHDYPEFESDEDVGDTFFWG